MKRGGAGCVGCKNWERRWGLGEGRGSRSEARQGGKHGFW